MCSTYKNFCNRSIILILLQTITLTSPFHNSTQDCNLLPKLVLKFVESRTGLYLVVYTSQNTKIVNEQLIFCFTNADSIHLIEPVKTKLLFEDLENNFLVFQLKLKKYIGEYWCEAFTTQLCQTNSNKILAYKRKRSDEYAVRLEISNICMKESCRLNDILKFWKEQLEKVLHNFEVVVRIMQVIDFNINNHTVEILIHITTNHPTNYKALKKVIEDERNIKIIFFRDSVYCQPDGIWPKTKINQGTIAEDFCLLSDDTPVVRHCQGDFLNGAIWKSAEKCTKMEVPSITGKLKNWSKSTQIDFSAVWFEIKNVDLSVLDIFYLNKIIRVVGNNSITFDVIDKLMNSNRSVLKQAQKLLNLTDALLTTIDVLPAPQKIEKNLQVYVTKPFETNITGFYLNRNEIKPIKMGDNFDLNQEFQLAVQVPAVILEQILNETQSTDFEIIYKIFNNDKFFIDRQYNAGSQILEISITDFGSYLQTPIPILFKSESKSQRCGFWDYDNGLNPKKGEWSELGGQHSVENNLHHCSFSHLTHFALLLMSDQETITPESLSNSDNFEIITIVGTTLSVFGIFGIFVTAGLFEKWRQKTGTKILLNLSVSILLELIGLNLSGIQVLKRSETNCRIIGMLLHYLVLSKFSWTLIYAYLQYCRFVWVLGAIPLNLILKSVIIGWGVPIIFVFFVGMLTHDSYASDTYNLCYPRGLILYLTVILPIGLIIIANVIIFTLIMYHLMCTDKISNDSHNKLFRLKLYLALLLFSVLGFPWAFGILGEIFQVTALFYLFCITATLQGFILFLFYVVLNKETRHFWMRKILMLK